MAEEVKINIDKEEVNNIITSETIYLYTAEGVAAKYWKENIEDILLKDGEYRTSKSLPNNIQNLASKLGFKYVYNQYSGTYIIN